MKRTLLAACAALLLTASPLYPQSQQWYEKIDLYGDLRLRYDATKRDGYQDVLRYRLRVGLEAALSDAITAGVEIRSGNPNNPISDNQSFGGGFSKHQFSIAEIFGDFRLSPRFSVVAGKFEHPRYWVVSDMQWDSDVTTEGFMERVELWSREDHLLTRLDASIYQLILAQTELGDAWLFGAQVRPTLRLGDNDTLTAGAGFDYMLDPQRVLDLTLAGELVGRVTNLLDESEQLISDFHILAAFLEWRNRAVEGWALTSSFFFYNNFGASDAVGTEIRADAQGKGSENKNAFFFRIAADQGREPRQVRIRFTYYYSQPDAFLYAFAQSDTRQASNLNGTRVDLRIGMPARTYFNISWYRTKPKLGEATTMNRWLIDYVMGF